MLKKLIKDIYDIWINEHPNQLAAALAFYGMFSFAPAIFVAFTVVGLFVDQVEFANHFYTRLESVLGTEIATMIQNSILSLTKTSPGGSVLISIISFLVILYTASGVFLQLQFVMNTIWQVPPPKQGGTIIFIRQQLFSFAIVIGVGVLGIVSILLNLTQAWLGGILDNFLRITSNQALGAGFSSFLLLTLTFLMFYKLLPVTHIAWGDVWIGAILAAVLIQVVVRLAGLFFRLTSTFSAIQVAADISIVLLGFNYIAQIFLIGAIFCRVYASLYGSRRPSLTNAKP